MELGIPTYFGPYGDDGREESIFSASSNSGRLSKLSESSSDSTIYQPTISKIFRRKSIRFAADSTLLESTDKMPPNPINQSNVVSQNLIAWQCDKKDITDSMAYLLATGIYSDVTFVVGQQEDRIDAHKLILMSRSPVFEAMFQRWEIEKEPLVHVPDAQFEHFLFFLKFVYSNEFPYDSVPNPKEIESVESALYLAHKYQVSGLITASLDYLKDVADKTNAVKMFSISKLFNATKLSKTSFHYIQKNVRNIFLEEPDILSMDIGTLCELLKLDELNLPEIDIFNGVMRWAKRQCELSEIPPTHANIRKVSERAIHLIRFPTMDPEDFKTEVVEKYEGLLLEKEIIQILFLLVNNTSENTSDGEELGSESNAVIKEDSCALPKQYSTLHFIITPRCMDYNSADEEENSGENDGTFGSDTDETVSMILERIESGSEDQDDEGIYDEEGEVDEETTGTEEEDEEDHYNEHSSDSDGW